VSANRKVRLDEIYELFPVLYERRSNTGTSLSGGEQQMLAIGRALMSKPKLVIFDEISLGLAPVAIDRLYETLHGRSRRSLRIDVNQSWVIGRVVMASRCDRWPKKPDRDLPRAPYVHILSGPPSIDLRPRPAQNRADSMRI
jgi:ABC-type Na+ transport system ATPase subunit NatA